MKRLFFFCLLLTACGGGDQQTEADPTATTIDALHADVRAQYLLIDSMTECSVPYQCGELVGFDCNSMLDGPKNYYNNLTGELVMMCGGACLVPDLSDPKRCTACPPDEWACKSI